MSLPAAVPLTQSLTAHTGLVGHVADGPALVDAFHEPPPALRGQGRVGVQAHVPTRVDRMFDSLAQLVSQLPTYPVDFLPLLW